MIRQPPSIIEELLSPLVLDIECANWTTYVIGCLLEGGEEGDAWTTTDQDRLVDRVLARCKGRTVWAHAGGRYDWLWFLDRINRRGIKWSATAAGSTIVWIEIGEGKETITLMDSYRLWPDPLARIGELLGLPKLDVGLECVCGRDCGGYCAITPEVAPKIREYMIRDCRVLARALSWIANLCLRHSIPLKRTVGSTAWNDAQQMLGLPRADKVIDLKTAVLLRDGYYGGRVEAYRLAAESGRSYDIHSAYPWSLSTTPVSFSAPDFSRRTDIDRTGIYWATVTVPPTDLPPLPFRDLDAHRLAFVHGKLDGAWTDIELKHAIKCGAKIERIKASATVTDERIWFDQWLKARASLRAHYGYRSAEGEWIKWLVNSFTGKTAQAPTVYDVQIGEPPCKCKRGLECECRIALDPDGKFWARRRSQVAPSGHIMVAALLTSRVRVEGHEQLSEVQPDQKVYIDTDGIYVMAEIMRRLGDAVGEWGDEGPWWEWECHAPKVYRCRREDKGSIKYKFRVKGARVRSEDAWQAYTHGDGIEIDGVKGLFGAIRDGGSLFVRRAGADGHVSRRHLAPPRPLVGSRLRDGDVTRALAIEDYLQLAAA